MTYQWFLVGTAIVLLGHVWLASYPGLRLIGKALLFVFSMWLFVSALWFGIKDLIPRGSLAYIIIIVPIFICIEDFTRTWFVVSGVRKTASIAASSLAFAAVASLVEIVVQTSDLIAAAGSKTLGLPASGDVAFFDAFFSSYSMPLATVGINAIRPVIHYQLCVFLYYSWRLRGWSIYAAMIMSHALLDVTIELLDDSYHVSYEVNFVITFLFVMLLCAATMWIRRRSISDIRLAHNLQPMGGTQDR